ncbi:hypothetical protein KIW84_041091 [Lathyrus oleraceus]|uniref:Myosin motor domain-containing protein n=1 Tax=Pisum sativum TaxID=3888 RepID=A0A9D4XAM4_PEA|nr:hypothetical protein KIW84_041091 [Pisum sativum]
MFLNKVNVHNDERILKRSTVLSQGWHDLQQGKTFVHVPGIGCILFLQIVVGISPQAEFLLKFFPRAGYLLGFLPNRFFSRADFVEQSLCCDSSSFRALVEVFTSLPFSRAVIFSSSTVVVPFGSFEQFCINLTNEKLQQHFNQHVFKMEQEEYTKEEIDWSYIEFVDNQDVLDLIEKKPGGVIALLDEACMFPRSTHETFAEKLYQTLKDNKRFSKPKLSRTDFTINHYAGDVTYQTDIFLDKNKDYVVPEHAALLCASKCSFVSGLFPPLHEESTKSTKFSSIATQFKQQMQSLLETLSATEPHYIRCVKPNNLLKPGIFENNDVLQQLRCGGVMEAIRISCAGYPTRKNFDEFVQRFSIMEPKVLKSCPDEMTACKRLLDKANLKDYQVVVLILISVIAFLFARR